MSRFPFFRHSLGEILIYFDTNKLNYAEDVPLTQMPCAKA